MEQPPPPMVLYQLATGHYLSSALYAAAKLGVADHLADGPQTAEALAAKTETHAPSLRRMLRLLVTAGVFIEDESGRFATTPVGAALASGPHSFNPAVQLFAGPSVVAAWSDILETVRTGEQAFARVHGTGSFEYFEDRPEEAAIFDQAMAAFTTSIASAVAATYDFAPFTKIIDIGGGEGALLAGILKAHPHLSGAVFDLPRLADRARAFIARAELTDRCTFLAGDFFESVPSGYDAYLLKHVIHDWDDERASAILRNVRAAMPEQAKLLLVEGVYPARVDTSPASAGAARNDCNMMVATGGKQRSEEELRNLYERSGFRLVRVIPTPARVSIIEGSGS